MVKKGKKESVVAATFETSSTPDAGDDHPENDLAVGEDLDALRAKLREKEREAAENYNRYVRAAADLENYKKRALRDKADAVKYGNENVIRDLLPLTDSLDRALKQAEASCDFEAFRKGLEMLRGQLLGSLEKHGVQAIDSLEKPFDPNVHEAMMQVDSDAHEDNQVVDEFEKGYTLNGRLLRPARVSVCKKRTNEDVCE
ncbi:MAG TPA: nucleotide exchange factor GrpE [Syntrophus sp. (in: bacteria)]|jgi:molecular chaperone GrpE|nr:nucleotide exchange factor GrpE [Syntrophus sp. (in: bacteria)]